MELTVLFMISCVLTARKFEKLKMQLASLAYSVTFIVICFVLLFTVDIDVVSRALLNFFDADLYFDVRAALLDAMAMTYYGVSIVGALIVTTAVQLAVTVIDAARVMVRYCFFAKESLARKFKKAYFRFAQFGRIVYFPKRINLLYCRMLN